MPSFQPHEIIPPSYSGREQAYVKHFLLEGYLERLLYIIGWNASQLGYKEVIFVDCFAGPWQDTSEDLSATSIGISLRLLSKIQGDLEKAGRRVSFGALFVELDNNAFKRLSNFLNAKTPTNVRATAIHGDFVERIPEILGHCSADKFAFFFIDPKGWMEIKPQVINDLLERPSSEFLINFMYDFINRTVSMADFQMDMTELFDQPVDCLRLPSEASVRESHILDMYRSAVVARASVSKHRVLSGYVSILDPTIDRTKYHLIYLTRHPLGIIEFMTQSEKMTAVQTKVRAAAKLKKKTLNTGIEDLFGIDDAQAAAEALQDLSQIEKYWLELINGQALTVTAEIFAMALSQTNCFPSELQNSVKRLIDKGLVENLDCNISRRRKKFVDFEKNERLKYIGPVPYKSNITNYKP